MRSKTKNIAPWLAAAVLVACGIPGPLALACERTGQVSETSDEAASDGAHTADAPVRDLPDHLRAQAVRGPSGDASGAYVDPEKARELSDRIHQEVQDAAAIGGGRPR